MSPGSARENSLVCGPGRTLMTAAMLGNDSLVATVPGVMEALNSTIHRLS